MNGKWALSAKDEGTLGLSDAFCPAQHNQEPLLFYLFFLFEVHSLVFFLANFCRYWLWDLQAPVAGVRACGSVCCRQEFGSTCKLQDCREFFLLWSVWFSTQRWLDSSGPRGRFWWRGLSSITSSVVTVVWPSSTRAALLQQSLINNVEHSWKGKWAKTTKLDGYCEATP